ncbi:MAG: hypothetical protein ACPLPX_00895 [Candidatus Kapaibacteriota bacterium]
MIRINFFLLLELVCFFLVANKLYSTPLLSIWSGNKCSKCHINPQGGGIRSEFGWKFLRDASQNPIGKDEIKKIYELFDKSEYWGKISFGDTLHEELSSKFAFGFDLRLQSIRSHKTEVAKRRFFPMESAFYFLIQPSEFFNINGQYNVGPRVFQGQDNWMLSANFKITDFLPEVQIGKFQPSFGVRDCDMTRFDRRIASVDYTSSLFPPDYSEFGLEFSYRKFEWFDFYAGFFDSRFLSYVTIFGDKSIVVKHNPTFTTKVVIYPQLFEDFLTFSFLGTSVLVNGNFLYSSTFLALNLFERFGVFVEYAHSSLKDTRNTNNYTLKLMYFLSRGIIPFLTFENGVSRINITAKNVWELVNQSAILGINYFPVPYFELVAEYRFFKSMENKSTRWAFQIHFYY